MSLHPAAVAEPSETPGSASDCEFANSLGEFEFYALFSKDKVFLNWIIEHAFENGQCAHCREIIKARHSAASNDRFWIEIDEYLAAGQRKFAAFRQKLVT